MELLISSHFQPSPLASKLLAASQKGEHCTSVSPCQYIAYPLQVLCSAFSWWQVLLGTMRPQHSICKGQSVWPNGQAGWWGQEKSQWLLWWRRSYKNFQVQMSTPRHLLCPGWRGCRTDMSTSRHTLTHFGDWRRPSRPLSSACAEDWHFRHFPVWVRTSWPNPRPHPSVLLNVYRETSANMAAGCWLATKLWGSVEDLYRRTGFVASTRPKIWPAWLSIAEEEEEEASTSPKGFLWAPTGLGHIWRLKVSKMGQDCRMWLVVWGPVLHGHLSEWEIFSL